MFLKIKKTALPFCVNRNAPTLKLGINQKTEVMTSVFFLYPIQADPISQPAQGGHKAGELYKDALFAGFNAQ